jgi:hypothetical protein
MPTAAHPTAPSGPPHVFALPLVRELTPPPATQGEPRTW